MRKIYVTGLGVISGIGKGVEENLDSLKAGKHGMGKITLFPTALDVPVSEVKQSNEELKKLLSLPSGKTYSRTALLGLWAAQEAARDAELDFTSPRIGLISSTSIVNPEKPDVPLNKNDAFQKIQKRRVQEKR